MVECGIGFGCCLYLRKNAYIGLMAHRPLYGHHALRTRLTNAHLAGTLPASILLVGQRGVGKQRLALWLGQLLVCDQVLPNQLTEPCGTCQQCRYAERGNHPDIHWFFPRPRLKDGDASVDDVKLDMAEAIAERIADDGLWGPSSGTDGIYVATVRSLIHQAAQRPAMAKRAVFVVGDAERMVSQEGADQAANAFLKLLEEPPNGTTLILTSSEPGALLPTIRSRVITVRVAPVSTDQVRAFVDDQAVQRRFAKSPLGDAVGRAAGAPGELIAGETMSSAFASARRVLSAALLPMTPDGTAERAKTAAKQGSAGARGVFTDMLEALTVLLHERTQQLVASGHESDARRTAHAIVDVEDTKMRAQGNVSPQLLTASLLASLHRTLKPST